MRKRNRIALLVGVMLLLSGYIGYPNAPVQFFGKSSNWEAVYTAHTQDGERMVTSGVIRYIGLEADAPKEIDYQLKSDLKENTGTNISVNDTKAKIGMSACEGCHVIQADDTFLLSIQWGENEEAMELNPEK